MDDRSEEDEVVVEGIPAKKGKKKCKRKSGSKKKKASSQLPTADVEQIQPEPVQSLTERWATSLNMATAMAMPGSTELFKVHPTASLEWEINDSMQTSKFSDFYHCVCSAVTKAKGPQAAFNWRWFDPNLLLSELQLHEFGRVDWYAHVSADNSNPKLNLNHIQALFSRLNEAEQMSMLKKCVIEPMDVYLANNKNNKAMEAEEVGDVRRARDDYEAALGLDPHCLAALYNYGEMLAKLGQYSQAERYLSRLLLIDFGNARAWGVRAMCYEGTRSFDKAVVCYENALRIDNTSETRLRNFAVLMVEIQNFDRAKALYEDLIAMDPRNGVVIGEYADMLHSMDLKEESAAAFERALATKNVNSTVINDYAVLLRKMSKEKNDPALLKKASKLINSIPNPSIYERMNQLNMNSSHY